MKCISPCDLVYLQKDKQSFSLSLNAAEINTNKSFSLSLNTAETDTNKSLLDTNPQVCRSWQGLTSNGFPSVWLLPFLSPVWSQQKHINHDCIWASREVLDFVKEMDTRSLREGFHCSSVFTTLEKNSYFFYCTWHSMHDVFVTIMGCVGIVD